MLVGTDNPALDSSYVFCLNGSTMMTSMRSNPVLSYRSVNEVSGIQNSCFTLCAATNAATLCLCVFRGQHVRDVHWISETTAVCATGEGCMQLFNVNRTEQHAITHLATISNIHTKHIRELAVKRGDGATIASGGPQPQRARTSRVLELYCDFTMSAVCCCRLRFRPLHHSALQR